MRALFEILFSVGLTEIRTHVPFVAAVPSFRVGDKCVKLWYFCENLLSCKLCKFYSLFLFPYCKISIEYLLSLDYSFL